MDSAYPIIKDEFKDDIELKIAYCQDANAAAWEDLWFSQYLADKYNLNFEGEGIAGSGLGERKNIMFSSGDLPDIMMEMWVSNSEILKYGVEEGMLLKMDEYISEELTPGIWHFLYGDYASEGLTVRLRTGISIRCLTLFPEKIPRHMALSRFISLIWRQWGWMAFPRRWTNSWIFCTRSRNRIPRAWEAKTCIPGAEA